LLASAFGEPIERDAYEDRWKRNELELRRLENAHGSDRESNCPRIEELLAEQERIEHEPGDAATAEMRRCSGLS
jgi:hypothetical protein